MTRAPAPRTRTKAHPTAWVRHTSPSLDEADWPPDTPPSLEHSCACCIPTRRREVRGIVRTTSRIRVNVVDTSTEFVKQRRSVSTPVRMKVGQLHIRQTSGHKLSCVLERQVKDSRAVAQRTDPPVAKVNSRRRLDGNRQPWGLRHLQVSGGTSG